jgi:ATP-dependent Clp protease, protease subunit
MKTPLRSELPKSLMRAREMATQLRSTVKPIAKSEGDTGSLYIYEPIGESIWFGGISAKTVATEVDRFAGKKTLNVYINSEGGDVFEAKAMYNAIGRFDGTVNVHIDGIAASAATLVMLAGDNIIAAQNATLMIHEIWTAVMGNADDFRAMANLLDKENAMLAQMYCSKTGNKCDPEKVKKMMHDETWMNADEAMANGFVNSVDKVEVAVAARTSVMLNAYNKTPNQFKSNSLTNKAKLASLDLRTPAPAKMGQPISPKA